MIQKLKTFLKKIYKKNLEMICRISFPKKCKKIDEYKKLKKEENKRKKWNKNENKRNKYNLQLNLNLKKQNHINIYIIIIIIILIWILIIKKWNYFKIHNINIISPDWISNTYILEKKLNYLKNKLLFTIDKKEVINIIQKTEQNIENIEISKKYPDTLQIKVFSSNILFKTNLKWKNYLITNNWVLIPTKWKKTDSIDLNIQNFEMEKYPDYKKVLESTNLDLILKLKNNLIKNITNLKVNNIIYYKTEKEIHFIINNNTRLIFDLYWDTKTQLKQLFVFNKEKKEITKPGIFYIDNRIKNKLFYCPTQETKKCIKNINFIYWEKLKIQDFNIKNN